MLRRILTYDPPLWVTAALLFGLALAIPFFVDGALSLPTLVVAGACFGAQAARRRRLAARQARPA